jgi:hypothetical protein
MTYDIVTRLRAVEEYVTAFPKSVRSYFNPLIIGEAADEIERLRDELGAIRSDYQRLEMKWLRTTRR